MALLALFKPCSKGSRILQSKAGTAGRLPLQVCNLQDMQQGISRGWSRAEPGQAAAPCKQTAAKRLELLQDHNSLGKQPQTLSTLCAAAVCTCLL